LRLASLLWRLRRATTMETGLFEIQAEHLLGCRQARQQLLPDSRDATHAIFARTNSESRNVSEPSHNAVFCGWSICPISRSIASTDTKRTCGVRPGGSCLRSMHCIGTNRRSEGAVSGSVPHWRVRGSNTNFDEMQRVLKNRHRHKRHVLRAGPTSNNSCCIAVISGKGGDNR